MDLFSREVRFIQTNNIEKAHTVSNNELKGVMDQLLDTLRTLSTHAKESQDTKMKQISLIGGTAFLTTAFLCIFSIIVGALAGLVVTHHIVSSVHKLKEATEHIAEGDFDYDPLIKTQDEIGGLSEAFLTMGKRLRKLEEMYLDASPLTRLPGGIAIENVLKKRIESNHPLAFCVLDLDNFKAFNDRYGYANGSEVIKETAKIIEAVVKSKGTPDDFVGHVGGDDFVVITTPDAMRDVSSEIIREFDQRIPGFYDARDREQGFILGKTRQGVEMQFPIMTISIAIVTNERRHLTNSLEASEIAAELKDYAKTIPKSVYVVDKRRNA
jgi:GGDEF domain-containing protein